MVSHVLWLQYLLYMNPAVGLNYNLVTPNCFVFNSNCNVRTCNRVVNIATPLDSEILEIKYFFGEMPFTWFIDSNDHESQKVLEDHHLNLKATLPTMIASLDTIKEHHYNHEIDIKIIEANSKELDDWVSIVAPSFNVEKSELLSVVQLFNRLIIPGSLILYLGCYNQKPVVTGMAIYHKPLVCLHWISTIPEFRNRGLGTTITHRILFDAKNNNCTQALLISSLSGKNIYERLGFQEFGLYTIYGNY